MPKFIYCPKLEPKTSVKPYNIQYCYDRPRDEVTELFQILKSTYSGNNHLTKALALGQLLFLLEQCNEMVDDEASDHAIAEYEERMNQIMDNHGDRSG